MGVIVHKAVIVTTRDYGISQYQPDHGPKIPMPDIEAFREELPWEVEHLLLGPAEGINGFVTYFWSPSGSKSGYALDTMAEEWRDRFLGLWDWRDEDGASPYDVVVIEYGEDMVSDGVKARVHEPYAWYNRAEED